MLRLTRYNFKKSVTPKEKRVSIPVGVRIALWNGYYGKKGKVKCQCCEECEIQPLTFNAGHIQSVYNGGCTKIYNLAPICQICNSSMGAMNMHIYMCDYGLNVKRFMKGYVKIAENFVNNQYFLPPSKNINKLLLISCEDNPHKFLKKIEKLMHLSRKINPEVKEDLTAILHVLRYVHQRCC